MALVISQEIRARLAAGLAAALGGTLQGRTHVLVEIGGSPLTIAPFKGSEARIHCAEIPRRCGCSPPRER